MELKKVKRHPDENECRFVMKIYTMLHFLRIVLAFCGKKFHVKHKKTGRCYTPGEEINS